MPVPSNAVEYNRQWREAKGFAFYIMKNKNFGEIVYKIEPEDNPFDWHAIWKSPLEAMGEN
jgi:hypothetical protein